VRVLLSGESAEETLRLGTWLRSDAELRPYVRQVARPPGDGEMGSLLSVIEVAVATGGAASVLASALKAWLEQPRESSIEVVVERGPNASAAIRITADRVTAVEVGELLRRAAEVREMGDGVETEAEG
jgi:hypothetical protein